MDNNYGERKVLLSIKVSTLVVLFVVATVLLVTAAILGNISKDNSEELALKTEEKEISTEKTAENNLDENETTEEVVDKDSTPVVVALNEDTAVTIRQVEAITSRSITDKERENFMIDELEGAINEVVEEPAPEPEPEPEPEVVTTPIEDVTISVDMDLTVRTGLSRDDFISLMARVPADTSGFFEENAGLIYDMCEKYELNEIFFCGLISAESGWTIAGNHRRTHNYISLMSSGGLISYASLESGMETAAKTLHERYLSEGGSCYYGKTLSAMKTRFCPGSTTWVGLVYGRMEQIIKAK